MQENGEEGRYSTEQQIVLIQGSISQASWPLLQSRVDACPSGPGADESGREAGGWMP